MPRSKDQKQREYLDRVMKGYPNKKWYIKEEKDTPSTLKWDCIALNACADDGLTREQARDFLEDYSDKAADAYYKELEKQLAEFKKL